MTPLERAVKLERAAADWIREHPKEKHPERGSAWQGVEDALMEQAIIMQDDEDTK